MVAEFSEYTQQRDKFAAIALKIVLEFEIADMENEGLGDNVERPAVWAYAIADAMMKEREVLHG